MARAWGIWTQSKLDLLRDYLDAFTTTTKNKSSERIYLDLFGGEPENVDRTTLNPIDGSARIALDVTDPPFTRLRFFEPLRERMQRESEGVMDLFSSSGVEVPDARPRSYGRIPMPDDPPEQPRDHDPDLCRFCAPDAEWDDHSGAGDDLEEEYLLDGDL